MTKLYVIINGKYEVSISVREDNSEISISVPEDNSEDNIASPSLTDVDNLISGNFFPAESQSSDNESSWATILADEGKNSEEFVIDVSHFSDQDLYSLTQLLEKIFSDQSLKRFTIGNTNVYDALYQLLQPNTTELDKAELIDTIGKTIIEELSEEQKNAIVKLLKLVLKDPLPAYLEQYPWNKTVSDLILSAFQSMCAGTEVERLVLPKVSKMNESIAGQAITAINNLTYCDLNLVQICEAWIDYRANLPESRQNNKVVLNGQRVIANLVKKAVNKENHDKKDANRFETLQLMDKILNSSPTQFFLARNFYFLYKELNGKKVKSKAEKNDFKALQYFMGLSNSDFIQIQSSLSFDGKRFYSSETIPQDIKYSSKIRTVLEKSGIVQKDAGVAQGPRIRLPISNIDRERLKGLRDFLNGRGEKPGDDILEHAIHKFVKNKTGKEILPYLPLLAQLTKKVQLDLKFRDTEANRLFQLPPRHFALCWDLLRCQQNQKNNVSHYTKKKGLSLFTQFLSVNEVQKVNSLVEALLIIAQTNNNTGVDLKGELDKENFQTLLWVMRESVQPLKVIIKNSGLLQKYIPLPFMKNKEEKKNNVSQRFSVTPNAENEDATVVSQPPVKSNLDSLDDNFEKIEFNSKSESLIDSSDDESSSDIKFK